MFCFVLHKLARTIGNAPTSMGFQAIANLSQLRPDLIIFTISLLETTSHLDIISLIRFFGMS